jgi:phage gp36-like protein
MAFATQQDIIDYLGSSGDVALAQMTDPDATTIDSILVAKFLSRADDEIYSYITASLTVPLVAPYPTLLVKIAAIIAVYWMWAGDERPERIKDDYRWATTLLANVRDGKQSLGLIADGSEATETTSLNDVSYSMADTVFSTTVLGTY